MYWLKKRMLPIPALVGSHPALALSFRYWNDRREQGCLPARCEVDTPQYRLVVPDTHWISMRKLHDDQAVDLGPMASFGDAVAAGLGRREPARLGDALLDDLQNAAFVGAPLFLMLQLSLHDEPFDYQLLLLPHADDGSTVTELALIAKAGALELLPSGLGLPS